MRIGIVILGCDKNVVDVQYIAGLLEDKGHDVVEADVEDDALDAVIVSTCSFIQDARDETLGTIHQWCAKKAKERFGLFIVGCYPQIAAQELEERFSEIDGLFGVGKWSEIADAVEQCINLSEGCLCSVSQPDMTLSSTFPRARLRNTPYDFLKIADGCSHSCTFCAIPSIKGPYRSVPKRILLDEARRLLDNGVKEINLVAQDITRYGYDLDEQTNLVDLLESLCNIPGEFWIRLLYLYPAGITDELLDLIKAEDKICNYLDIPLQHFDREILKQMQRPEHQIDGLRLIERIRERIPDIALRSTFIVGFPGETNSAFQTLLEGVRSAQLDHAGAFTFSPEPATQAATLKDQVNRKTADMRYNMLMKVQAKISRVHNKRRLETMELVMVEGKIPDAAMYIGRSKFQAPEVDGIVTFYSDISLHPGQFITVTINKADIYDLRATLVGLYSNG